MKAPARDLVVTLFPIGEVVRVLVGIKGFDRANLVRVARKWRIQGHGMGVTRRGRCHGARPRDSGGVDWSPCVSTVATGLTRVKKTLPKFDNAKKPVWIKIKASNSHAQTLFVQSRNPLHLIGVIK
jgi:hypothetical protein